VGGFGRAKIKAQIENQPRREERDFAQTTFTVFQKATGIMRLTIAVFFSLILGVASCIHAEGSNSTAETLDAVTRKLFIDPSSTSVTLGKASLIVSPLTHRNGNYEGDYQLKVRPYFFKSEKGTLLLAAADDSVRKLQAGTAIAFTGKAVTRKDGKTHVVLGKATPSSRDGGSVTFSIITENGKMVFKTSYHFET
jgi:hypothetical protein